MAKNYKYFLLATLGSIGLLVVIVTTQEVYPASPSDFGLQEGDTISATDSSDPDVYTVNSWGYKRLFLNPVIFSFYDHLNGFTKVKSVSPSIRDAFVTSGLFRNCEINDPRVFTLEITGEDSGLLHWLNIAGDQAIQEDPNFFKRVFCINNLEFGWYNKSVDYRSLNEAPDYSFVIPEQATSLSVDLKVNGSNSPAPVIWDSKLLITWNSTNTSYCSGFEYLPLVNESTDKNNLPANGEIKVYARNSIFTPMENVAIHIACYNKGGTITEDFIEIPIEPTSKPSVTVKSPAGGEHIVLGRDYEITWIIKNLPTATLNIILYQSSPKSIYGGSFWYIAKNINNNHSFTWDTNKTLEPDAKRGTTTTKLSPGNYFVFILNSEETIYGASRTWFTISP